MAKNLVPSEIVTFIDRRFPKAKEFQGKADQSEFKFLFGHGGALSALVSLVEQVDDALLPASADDLADLLLATEFIKRQLKRWEISTKGEFSFIESTGRQNPVVMIRRVLEGCPDTPVPSPAENRLMFVKDPDYRAKLLSDLQEVEGDLNHGQWKSATVLGGSLIEALLLAALSSPGVTLQQSPTYSKLKNKNLDERDLKEYLPIAQELMLITNSGKELGLKAKDYRNLVHPGKQKRMQSSFSRATALTVRAALERIIEDLERAIP